MAKLLNTFIIIETKGYPCCRIAIITQEHCQEKSKDLVQLKDESLVSEVVATSSKLATLKPDWNEEFKL